MRERITNIIGIRAVALFVVAFASVGCSMSLYQSEGYSDDMYAVHSASQIDQKAALKAEAAQQQKEKRMAQWADELNMTTPTSSYSTLSLQDESYNTPYGERLLALSGVTSYQQNTSYSALEDLAAYDPSEYNATITDQGTIIVEPKYSASMYGSWDTSYYYNSAWIYGYPSWNYSFVWGYPRSYWSRWNVGFDYYNPWYGYSPYYFSWYGYRPPYYYHHRPSYRPPHYSTSHYKAPTKRIVRSASSYNAPSTNKSTTTRNSNGSTVGRTTSNSSSSYNRSATSNSSSSRSSSMSRSSSGSSSVSRSSSSSSGSSQRSNTNSFGR